VESILRHFDVVEKRMNTQQQPDSEPCLVWDTCEIAQQQAQVLLETGEADDVDQAFALACADSDLFSFAWEALTERLSVILSNLIQQVIGMPK
jgi:hypothetical protein